jgi:hypothetical protein
MASKRQKTGSRVPITGLQNDLVCCVFGYLLQKLSEVSCLLLVHKAWNFDLVYRAARALNFWIHVENTLPLIKDEPYHFWIADWFHVPTRWRSVFHNLYLMLESKEVRRIMQAIPADVLYDEAHVYLLNKNPQQFHFDNLRARKLYWNGRNTSEPVTNLHSDVVHLVLTQSPQCFLGECPGVEVLQIDMSAELYDAEPFFSNSTFPKIKELCLDAGGRSMQMWLDVMTRVKTLKITTYQDGLAASCVRNHFAHLPTPPALRHLSCSLCFFNVLTEDADLPNALARTNLETLHLWRAKPS